MTNATRVRDFLELFQPDLLPVPRVPTVRSPTQEEALFIDRARASCAAMVEGLRLCPTSPAGLGARLMLEELGETLATIQAGDLTQIADGLADLLYVVYWTAHVHGIPIDPIFEEVHRANMAKAPVCAACQGSRIAPKGPASLAIGGGPDFDCPLCRGKGRIVTRDAGGKVVKPEGWTPPDIAGLLHQDKKPRIFLIGPSGCGKTSVRNSLRRRSLADVEVFYSHGATFIRDDHAVTLTGFNDTDYVVQFTRGSVILGPARIRKIHFPNVDSRTSLIAEAILAHWPELGSTLADAQEDPHKAQPPTVGETTLGPIFPVEPSR